MQPKRAHDGLHSDSEGVVEHARDEMVEHSWAIVGDCWVGVDLDQPEFEVLVYHEVHPEELEVVVLLVVHIDWLV